MNENRRVYRGEQSPATPSQAASKGLLASLVGRKTASYTVTPPAARRALKPGLPRPPENVTRRPKITKFNEMTSQTSNAFESPSIKTHDAVTPMSASANANFKHPSEIRDRSFDIPTPSGQALVGSLERFHGKTGSRVTEDLEQRDRDGQNERRCLTMNRRSTSLAPEDIPQSSSSSSHRLVLPLGIASLQHPLASVEALIRASYSSLVIPDPPRLKRSSSWISPPTLLQSSNRLIQNEAFSHLSSCIPELDKKSNTQGSETSNISKEPLSSQNSDCSMDQRGALPSLPPVGDGRKISVLQRSHSCTGHRPGQPVDNSDNNSLNFDFNSASLGRPVKPKHNLSLQENVLQYKNWLQDTPKGTKGKFIRQNIKRSLPNKKKHTSAAAVRNSTVVKTVGTTPAVNETVQRAEEDVKRALMFYQDTVVKGITDMLPGSATVVFDMVVSLTRAVDELFPEKGQRLCELERALHLALANLVRWSDGVLLQEPDEPKETSVQSVVKGVEDATQALAELAREQERRRKMEESQLEEADHADSRTPGTMRTPPSDSEEISDDFHPQSRLDLSSLPTISTQSPSPPLCRHSSPTFPRSAFYHRDSSSTPTSRPTSHPSSCCSRNSSPCTNSDLTPCSCDRLSHSLSSDSIIRPPEGGVDAATMRDTSTSIAESCPGPPPNSLEPFPAQRNAKCSQSLPPPLPPKQRSHMRSNSSSPQYNTVSHLSAVTRGGSSLPFVRSTEHCHSLPSSGLTSQRTRESTDSGVGVGREATSYEALGDGTLTPRAGHNGVDSADSALRLSSASATNTSSPSQMSPASSLDSFNHEHDGLGLPHVLEDMKLDLASSVAVNCAGAEFRPQSYSHLAEHFGHLNIGMNGAGRSESMHIFQSHNFSRSKVSETHVHMESSSSVCYTQQLHRSSASYTRSSTSSSSSTLSSGSEGDTNSLTNVHSLSVPPQLPAKIRNTSANSPLGHRVLECDGSPEVPPKKGTSNIQNSGYSGSNSSMQSNSSSNSSSSSGYVSNTSLETRRHTVPESGGDQPPPIPPKKIKHVNQYVSLVNRLSQQGIDDGTETQLISERCASLSITSFEHSTVLIDSLEPKPALPPKQKHRNMSADTSMDEEMPSVECTSPDEEQRHQGSSGARSPICAVGEEDHGVLEELSATKHIEVKKEGDEGPNIRGGTPDALLVHACALYEGSLSEEDLAFQNAFVRTYRTFMTTKEVVEKLLYRYHKFSSLRSGDRTAKAAAGNAFSLLVYIVKDLTISDMEAELLQALSDFQHELLSKADFNRAKLLRKELVCKLEARKLHFKPRESLASIPVILKHATLLDFKAYEIAEQLTILDAELFKKVELPEALIWSREQSEERSPNLTEFTEHFNKMSFWFRTKILAQDDGREREKYVRQLIKILKYLRKINNFNSYLALLSALDSAPVRRLEWQKSITDGLKEYCALIDSSSSFKAYRNALAESKPPCIPYIGLILQDLTFINIGNSDYLSDGVVNFTKRWQQNNILENLSRFRKEDYNFKRNEQIMAVFDSFDHYWSEDQLWDQSKRIKPSGAKRCS